MRGIICTEATSQVSRLDNNKKKTKKIFKKNKNMITSTVIVKLI